MVKEPVVSVHMMTYNHAPYIGQAIEGVLQQKTDFPFELVVGEDCSMDGTREIVFDYQKKYRDIIRVISSDKNVGAHKNSHRTTKACRGKYLAFCEGDDYWHRSDKLDMQVKYLENNAGCVLVCSDYDQFHVDTGRCTRNVNWRRGLNPSATGPYELLRGGAGIQTCTVLTRTALLFQICSNDPILYQNSTFLAEDLPYWFELSQFGRIGYIGESLATYNRLPVSATSNPSPAVVLRSSISMKELILYLIEKYNLSESEKELHLEDLWKRKLKLAYYEQDNCLAWEAIKHLKRLSLTERIQFWGACNRLLNRIGSPLLRLFCRRMIPTVKKD